MTNVQTIPVFDVDTHFTEPPDLWTSRAPEKYRDEVMHVRRVANGDDMWFVRDHEVAPIGPGIVDKDGKRLAQNQSIPTFAEMHRAQTYVPERLTLMDSMNVHFEIMYPNVIGFGAHKMLQISSDEEVRLWHVTAYNDALADFQKESGGRILPQAVLPLWNIEASIQEMRRCREKLGMTGITMTDRPHDFGQPPLANREWERFFAVCQDLELPVNFHIASGGFEHLMGDYWGNRQIFSSAGEINVGLGAYAVTSAFLNNFKDITNVILTGMCDRFPRLKFVSVESGIGWLPFVIQSIEHFFNDTLTAKDRAFYKREPRQCFQEQIFTSYWFENGRAVKTYVEEFGADNIMFETDYPHPQSIYGYLSSKIEETLSSMPLSVQRKILYQNAEKVYGVKVPA